MNGNADSLILSNERPGNVIIYTSDDGRIKLDVQIGGETVWLTKGQMSQLFGRDRTVVGRHIVNIYNEGELQKDITCAKFAHMGVDGDQEYNSDYYNLDVIISVGYRVHSVQGVRFRQWANAVLKQYLLQGYCINRQVVALQQYVDDRLMKIEGRLDSQQEDIDFYIKTNQQPSELVIPTGCVWDAYSYLSDLVRTARKRVILIDNFIDDRTLLLLDKRAAGVEATVYTRYSEKAELDFAKHNAQCEPVQRVQLPHAVHDRYLIVDDNVWLLGSSVKDMGRGLTTIIRTEINPEYILGCVKM